MPRDGPNGRCQRAQAIRRRKQIWEALHPAGIQVAQVGSPEIGYGKPPAQEHGFATSTASVSGESKTAINRHLARADAIGDDLERVTGTSLDKGVELDALKAMPPEQRAPLIERAQAIKRRKAIWEALHPEEIQVGKVCPPESATGYKQPPPQEKGFAASTAAVSGESKRAINRHLARAEAIGDDVIPARAWEAQVTAR